MRKNSCTFVLQCTERHARQLVAPWKVVANQSWLRASEPFFPQPFVAQAPRKRRKNTGCKQGLESYEPHWPIHGWSLDNCVLFYVPAMPHGARIAVSQRAPDIPVLRGGVWDSPA